ncbi:hypothetical protein BCS42_05805 [Crenothrix sp. D3]|nr:hypothetical protein BCS42_05805 [Crenothrix sp. D3]
MTVVLKINMLNRSARAILSFLNELLLQLTKAFIALVIAPLIIANLGTNVFGAWKIIDRTTGFLSLGSFRPIELLPLSLAKDISNEDITYKQQQIGCTIAILVLTLPIVLTLACLLFHFKNTFIPISTEISDQVDLTLLIMLVYAVISPFFYVPRHIIKGMNMYYMRFGVSSTTTAITALLQYAVVSHGYTLPWFSATLYFPMFAGAAIDCAILAKNIPTIIQLVWPSAITTLLFFKKNLWMLLVDSCRCVFGMADLILIGLYFGVDATAIYSLTKTLVAFLFMPVHTLFSAALPGLGDLAGRKAQKTLLQLRTEQINVAIFFSFIIGVIVMFFNAPFVQLWIDEKHFGGEILSRWFIIASIIETLAKVEANYLDAFLNLKKQALCLAWATMTYLGIIVFFEPVLAWNVVPIAQIISQILLIILSWTRLSDSLKSETSHLARTVLRPLSIAIILGYSVSWVQLPAIKNWIELFIQAFGIATIAGIVSWFMILQKNDRKTLITRLLKTIGK